MEEIKLDFKLDICALDSTVQDRVYLKGSCEHCNEPLSSTKGGELLD
jgi:hypothetical protein